MDTDFWHQCWRTGQIGFHQSTVNPLLVRHFPSLALPPGARVFLPLCGKTLDIGWLLENGYRVAGAELSEVAIEQLFTGLAVTPEVADLGRLRCYSANNIDIFAGDIFDLSSAVLGAVDAVYDRAALVALPEEMRRRYTAHLVDISACAPQLLLCFEYDQRLMDGPPFSISAAEVAQHYDGRYALTLLERAQMADDLKGQVAATEYTWLLRPRTHG